MPESMREAVDGFERDRVAARRAYDRAEIMANAIKSEAPKRFRRADVHDCITAANEQRQLAIASPKSAEQANALATRLSDLAERIAALLEEDE